MQNRPTGKEIMELLIKLLSQQQGVQRTYKLKKIERR